MLSREDRLAIEELFGRIEDVERRSGPRDPEAEDLIRRKIAGQPAAPYYLAQTVVVQQEALKEAERRIAELEARGRQVEHRGPWDRPHDEDRRAGYGGGFLAGAAQTAMGVAGGMMLGSLIGSIFSGGEANAGELDAAPADESGVDAPDSDAGDFGGFDFGGDF